MKMLKDGGLEADGAQLVAKSDSTLRDMRLDFNQIHNDEAELVSGGFAELFDSGGIDRFFAI